MPFVLLRSWSWLLLFFLCRTTLAGVADSEVILTLERDYFNPFAFGVKYNLTFENIEDDIVLDITYTIFDNKDRQIFDTGTFQTTTFNQKKGGFYFFISSNSNSYSTTICIVGGLSDERNYTVVNKGLKSHYMNLPLQIILSPEKKQLIFSIKPTSAMADKCTFPKGFTQDGERAGTDLAKQHDFSAENRRGET